MASLACVCGLLFLMVIHYFNVTAGYDYQKWDLETVTAGDFTVEMTITQQQWDKFNGDLTRYQKEIGLGRAAPNHVANKIPIVTFEAFLEDWLEKKLTNLPKALETSDQRVPIRVANITFGFDNPEIIALMK